MEQTVAPLRSLGERLADRYRLDRLISSDGRVDVYEAEDERLQRRVSLKVLRPDPNADRARFDSEVKALALDHPDLARVFDAGEDDGDAFVVLELVDGPTQVLPVVDEDADHTAVLPVGLAPAQVESSPVPSPAAEAVGSVVASMWARRALLGAIAAVALLVLAAAAFGGNDLEAPPPSTQVVSDETSTTVAPSTTDAPTTTADEPRDRGNGKKDRDEEGDD